MTIFFDAQRDLWQPASSTMFASAGVAPYLAMKMDDLSSVTPVRSPGTVYAWRGSMFVAESDNTKVVRNGALVGPTKTIAGYKIYPNYRSWVVGDTVVQGQKIWATNAQLDGCKVIELKLTSLVLGAPSTYNPSDWEIVDDYEPWLGAYTEPTFTQQIANAATPMLWTLVGGTRSAGTYELIEGYSATAIFGSAGSVDCYQESNDISATAGDVMTIVVCVRRDTGSQPIFVEWTDDVNNTATISTGGDVTGGTGLLRHEIRFLGNGWMWASFTFTAVTTSTTTKVRVYATQIGTGAADIEMAYGGMADFFEGYMPVPTASTRPGDSAFKLASTSTAVADGVYSEATWLVSYYCSDRSLSPGSTLAVATTDGSPEAAFLRRPSSADQIRSTGGGHRVSYYEVDNTVTVTHELKDGGDATVSVFVPGATTEAETKAFTGSNVKTRSSWLLVQSNYVNKWRTHTRFFAVWLKKDVMDVEAEFGPDSFLP